MPWNKSTKQNYLTLPISIRYIHVYEIYSFAYVGPSFQFTEVIDLKIGETNQEIKWFSFYDTYRQWFPKPIRCIWIQNVTFGGKKKTTFGETK